MDFDLPADLTGTRVLDIGAWDGWFSFEKLPPGDFRVGATLEGYSLLESVKVGN